MTKHEIKNPIELAQKTIEDLLNDNLHKIESLNYLDTTTLSYKDSYRAPSEGKYLKQINDKFICLISNKSRYKSISVSKITNFIISDVKEINRHDNKIFGKEDIKKSYLLFLKNEKGTEVEFEIQGDSKTDVNRFQSVLNEYSNGFIFSGNKNIFYEFMSKYVLNKSKTIIDIYNNPGLIGENKFLYKNALVEYEEITYADKKGYIKCSDNKYIKLDNTGKCIPKLFKSKKSGRIVAKEFLENVILCWKDNYILPLLTIGHMVMSVFFPTFIKQGVPTLILYGETSQGKTSIIKCGLFMFGMPRESFYSGGSTNKSIEYISDSGNGINVCIDDLKASTIASDNFIEHIKHLYQGTVRTKMSKFGTELKQISICSPVVYSTNEKLPNYKEVQNRLNVFELFGQSFDDVNFKYFEINQKNVEELSLILPEILKYRVDDVLKKYNEVVAMLKNNIKETSQRVIFNIAYAYTGLMLLLEIANIELKDKNKLLIDYASSQVNRYEEVKNIVDKVLAEIPILSCTDKLDKDVDFRFDKFEKDNYTLENVVCFNKDILITKINQSNAYDKSKYIDLDVFNAYYKTHPRYRGTKTVRYKEDSYCSNMLMSRSSVVFCIDDFKNYDVFFCVQEPKPIDYLENNVPTF